MSWRILRVRMWEKGHSFSEIDRMNLQDIGDVLGYWHEKSRIEKHMRKSKLKGGNNDT